MVFEAAKTIFRNRNFPTILTFVSAIIAFSLSLVALLSSGEQGALKGYDILTLNSSTALQNAVKVDSTTGTAARGARPMDPRTTPAPMVRDGVVHLKERKISLPGLSAVSSFFASVGSDLSPTATGAPSATATGTGNILTDLESFASSLITGGITSVAEDLVKLLNNLAADITTELGIQQGYVLYMTGFCSGKYEPSYDSPNAKLNMTSCRKYSNISAPTNNSTVTIGTTKLDFSAIDLPNKVSSAGGPVTSILTAIFALQVIGIVCSGLLILLCPLHLILFTGFLMRLIIASLTAIAALTIAIDAGILTGVAIVARSLVNQLAGDLGLDAKTGGSFIALVWVSTVFLLTSTQVWLAQWFDNMFQRRTLVTTREISRPMLVKSAISAYPERPAQPVSTPTIGSIKRGGR